jgi:hypothetical protein
VGKSGDEGNGGQVGVGDGKERYTGAPRPYGGSDYAPKPYSGPNYAPKPYGGSDYAPKPYSGPDYAPKPYSGPDYAPKPGGVDTPIPKSSYKGKGPDYLGDNYRKTGKKGKDVNRSIYETSRFTKPQGPSTVIGSNGDIGGALLGKPSSGTMNGKSSIRDALLGAPNSGTKTP